MKVYIAVVAVTPNARAETQSNATAGACLQVRQLWMKSDIIRLRHRNVAFTRRSKLKETSVGSATCAVRALNQSGICSKAAAISL
jgi:hypothetical protein